MQMNRFDSSLKSVHRGISDFAAALSVLLYSHNAAPRNGNENGGSLLLAN